jgi:hypothetical protein
VSTRGRDERALVGAVRSALGSSLAGGDLAGDALTVASASMRSHAPFGTAAGAALCVLDRSSGALSCAAAGPAWAVLARSDGRLDVLGAPGHPLGGDAHDYATTHQLLLDGDRLVLVFGMPAVGESDVGVTDLSEVVRSAAASGAAIGRAILSARGGSDLAATVVVLEAAS